MKQANCANANYIFQQDKFYDIQYDTGDKSVQCGRKPDAVKLWLMFKLHGMDYFEQQIDETFYVARYLIFEKCIKNIFKLI